MSPRYKSLCKSNEQKKIFRPRINEILSYGQTDVKNISLLQIHIIVFMYSRSIPINILYFQKIKKNSFNIGKIGGRENKV